MTAFGGCSSAPTRPGQIQKDDFQYVKKYLSWMIQKEMGRYDVKGLSIGMVDNQRVVWTEGFGYADAEGQIPATPDTIYPIGSITKVMTATEIMKLVESGKIDLDRPVAEYLPDFSIPGRFGPVLPVTPRSLLAHHSGLPADYLRGMWAGKPESLSRLVENLREERLASPPQTLYKYSNLDYSLLGRIIEITGGEPYETVMQRDLLQPLGMTRSSFEIIPDLGKYYSKGYRKGKEMRRLTLRDLPAGSMLSNVTDMATYMRFVFAERSSQQTRVMKSETVKEMFTPQYKGLALDFGHEIGLSWMLSGLEVPGTGKVAWHDGGYPPYFGGLMVLPDENLGIIVLANSDEARNFVNRIMVKGMELALEAKHGMRVPQPVPPPQFNPVKMPAEMLRHFSGDYVVFGELSAISQKGDKLTIGVMGNRLDLVPVSNFEFIPVKTLFGFFSVPLMNFSVQFEAVDGREIALLKGLPAPFAFEKVPEYVVPDSWLKYLGEYQMEHQEDVFEIERLVLKSEGSALFAEVRLSSEVFGIADTETKIALLPVSDDEAIVFGLGYSEGGTLRVIPGSGEKKLVYSGLTFTPARSGGKPWKKRSEYEN